MQTLNHPVTILLKAMIKAFYFILFSAVFFIEFRFGSFEAGQSIPFIFLSIVKQLIKRSDWPRLIKGRMLVASPQLIILCRVTVIRWPAGQCQAFYPARVT